MASPTEAGLRECVSKFAKILNVPESDELFEYICGIDDEPALREYFCGLLDDSVAGNKTLINQFVAAWKVAQKSRGDNTSSVQSNYSKKEQNTTSNLKEGLSSLKSNKSKKNKRRDNASVKELSPLSDVSTVDRLTKNVDKTPPNRESHKVHYSPLFSEEGQDKLVIKLPGRHRCECQATKHRLVNNCMKCGRIVCSQEGSGPCHFCDNLVCTNEEQEAIDGDSKQSRLLLKKLSAQKPNKKSDNQVGDETSSLKKAVEHKDRLLEFDRTVKRRTKVIDDQSDFFGVDNRWLSAEERQALAKRESELDEKRENERKSTKITFDFAGRRVIEEKGYDDGVLDEEEFLRLTAKKGDDQSSDVLRQGYGGDLPRPMYNPTGFQAIRKGKDANDLKATTMRLQGRELQEMSDEGRCLSMHQPYASLIVSGLKEHEGRSWYTALRGRLWIASTMKKPIQQEVRDEENTIRALNHGKKLEFPSSYPVGALLGCVNIVDCLPHEDYKDRFPDGDLATPYVFICDNPQMLIVKFPIKGGRNIYKLDEDIHRAAKISLGNPK